ncbi:hypothetical protein LCGC14_2472180 [marine sediment metagenome]|uniref:Uncharacterized protein n=1 Tax=marine sediment metagenome TaxID=412755 RepID=A0A0F9BXW8_9ZZZZ
MANTTQDIRRVKVQVSMAELQTLLIAKAQEAGFIDFTPDRIQLYQNGDDGAGNDVYEILFEQDIPAV